MQEKDAQTRIRKERKGNADMRRRQILDATVQSIVENGLSRTTLATVATQAGLSQGVAVFYFQSKANLLTAALQDAYEKYENNWMSALDNAGPDPVDRLIAVVEADFDPSVCNRDALSVWFAFWGELKSTPNYASIAADFDARRAQAIRIVCGALLGKASRERAERLSEWIDTITDGLWLKLHLYPTEFTRDEAITTARHFMADAIPEHADRIRV